MDVYYDNFGEIINFLNSLISSETNYIYRGYNHNDEIYPAIIREKNYSSYEEELLNEFEKYGLAYFSPNNHMEFLSNAQHFGLPTRLLDFTYNPYIALFFALYKKKDDCDGDEYYKIIYCDINKCKILDNDVNYTTRQIHRYEEKNISPYKVMKRMSYTKELIKRFKNFSLSEQIGVVTPNFTNQRITMQQGLFMLPMTLDREKHKQIIEKNTEKILIHKSVRDELIKYLNKLGFNSYKLMPDLASVCYSVKKEILDNN